MSLFAFQLHVCGEVNACVDQPVQQIDLLSVNEHTLDPPPFAALLQLNSMAVFSAKCCPGINSSRRINKNLHFLHLRQRMRSRYKFYPELW